MKKKTHGTRYSYNKGCRCDQCRKANTTYVFQYRHKRAKLPSQPAYRNYHPWEPWEDKLASDYSKSARQIALKLERTPEAVANRRRVLLARRNKQENKNQG